MRRAAMALAVAALGWAGACGGEREIVYSSATPQAPPSFHVDPGSTGGRCDDDRPPILAEDPATPWCTIERALDEVPAGGVAVLHGPRHPRLELAGVDRTDEPFTLRGAEGETVAVAGLTLEDSAGLRFERLRLTDRTFIQAGSRDVVLADNDLTGTGSVWVLAAERVALVRNRVHDLEAGTEGGAQALRVAADDEGPSRDVTIRDNRLERLPDDAIQLGAPEGVLIAGNLIRDVHPGGFGEHADAIQVVGGRDVVIRGNEIRDVEHGLLFTDAEAAGVVMENNLIAGVTGGLGLKTEGTYGMPGLVVRHNTWADTRYGVQFRGEFPDAVVVNNIFDHVDGLANQPGAARNLVAEERSGFEYGDDVIFGPPAYADPQSLELAAGSPGVDAGTAEGALPADRLGRPRTDDPATANTGTGTPPYVDVGAHERPAG